MPRLHLIFPDGTLVVGDTYRELEDAIRVAQWRPYKTRREFRRDLRRRARLWSGRNFTKPVLHQTSKAFVYELINSGMCMLMPAPDPSSTNRQEQ